MNRNHDLQFSLLALFIIVAIFAVILAIAVPPWTKLVDWALGL